MLQSEASEGQGNGHHQQLEEQQGEEGTPNYQGEQQHTQKKRVRSGDSLSETDAEAFVLKQLVNASEEQRLQHWIVDTVVVTRGHLVAWLFFSQKRGHVMRKHTRRVQPKSIIRSFRQQSLRFKGTKEVTGAHLSSRHATTKGTPIAIVYRKDHQGTVLSEELDTEDLMDMFEHPSMMETVIAIQPRLRGFPIHGCGVFLHTCRQTRTISRVTGRTELDVVHETHELLDQPFALHSLHDSAAFAASRTATTLGAAASTRSLHGAGASAATVAATGADATPAADAPASPASPTSPTFRRNRRMRGMDGAKLAISEGHRHTLAIVAEDLVALTEQVSGRRVGGADFLFVFDSSWRPHFLFSTRITLPRTDTDTSTGAIATTTSETAASHAQKAGISWRPHALFAGRPRSSLASASPFGGLAHKKAAGSQGGTKAAMTASAPALMNAAGGTSKAPGMSLAAAARVSIAGSKLQKLLRANAHEVEEMFTLDPEESEERGDMKQDGRRASAYPLRGHVTPSHDRKYHAQLNPSYMQHGLPGCTGSFCFGDYCNLMQLQRRGEVSNADVAKIVDGITTSNGPLTADQDNGNAEEKQGLSSGHDRRHLHHTPSGADELHVDVSGVNGSTDGGGQYAGVEVKERKQPPPHHERHRSGSHFRDNHEMEAAFRRHVRFSERALPEDPLRPQVPHGLEQAGVDGLPYNQLPTNTSVPARNHRTGNIDMYGQVTAPFRVTYRTILMARAEEKFLGEKMALPASMDYHLDDETLVTFAVRRHLQSLSGYCKEQAERHCLKLSGMQAYRSRRDLRAMYQKLIYSSALEQVHMSRLYQTVPVCVMCNRLYTLLDRHRATMMQRDDMGVDFAGAEAVRHLSYDDKHGQGNRAVKETARVYREPVDASTRLEAQQFRHNPGQHAGAGPHADGTGKATERPTAYAKPRSHTSGSGMRKRPRSASATVLRRRAARNTARTDDIGQEEVDADGALQNDEQHADGQEVLEPLGPEEAPVVRRTDQSRPRSAGLSRLSKGSLANAMVEITSRHRGHRRARPVSANPAGRRRGPRDRHRHTSGRREGVPDDDETSREARMRRQRERRQHLQRQSSRSKRRPRSANAALRAAPRHHTLHAHLPRPQLQPQSYIQSGDNADADQEETRPLRSYMSESRHQTNTAPATAGAIAPDEERPIRGTTASSDWQTENGQVEQKLQEEDTPKTDAATLAVLQSVLQSIREPSATAGHDEQNLDTGDAKEPAPTGGMAVQQDAKDRYSPVLVGNQQLTNGAPALADALAARKGDQTPRTAATDAAATPDANGPSGSLPADENTRPVTGTDAADAAATPGEHDAPHATEPHSTSKIGQLPLDLGSTAKSPRSANVEASQTAAATPHAAGTPTVSSEGTRAQTVTEVGGEPMHTGVAATGKRSRFAQFGWAPKMRFFFRKSGNRAQEHGHTTNVDT